MTEPLEGIFPPQQTLSISETLSTDLPQFVPHYEVIYWSIWNLFFKRCSTMSMPIKSYLDKLKSSSDSDKAIASEIAYWHNQNDFAKSCVEEIENNALCKRMQLLLTNVGELRKQIKNDAADAYNTSDEMKFVLCDYNLQTFDGSTSDSGKINEVLHTECENMKKLIDGGQCSWRFHLIYASIICRISLDSKSVQQQIDLAKGKLGSDANSHYAYLALTGDIYVRMKQFDKATDHLTKACNVINNDGYCRSRLIYTYLQQRHFNEAKDLWNKCKADLQGAGITDDILNGITSYINLYENPDDEKNNESILSWSGAEESGYIGIPLKLYNLAFKSGKFSGDAKLAIFEAEEYIKAGEFTEKNNSLAEGATHLERMVSSFLKFSVDMYVNDEDDAWDMQGPTMDNVFSTFPRPLFDDILDALFLENYLLGMFKLRWKGDCKNAFRFSIICNCRGNMNSYIGEVIGFQNAGMSDVAVQKIEEIQKFISVTALELFPIDAKRMKGGDDCKSAENELINLIKQNNNNLDALLSLSDIYISQGKYQAALLLMQQPIEQDTHACNKNLELKMKWASILFFNGYLPLAMQILRDYATKDISCSAHEYYCGLCTAVFYEIGRSKELDKMELSNKLKGQSFWMMRHLCHKYWVEFFVKKKKKKKAKQPKEGKHQYDKAVDIAKKLSKSFEQHPLGYAMLARSMAGIIDIYDAEKVKENISKSCECAEALLSANNILPRLYYESMVHCGIAAYMIGEDGSEYYNKATSNAAHGETILMKLQKDRISTKLDQQGIRDILIQIAAKELNMNAYEKGLPLFEYSLDAAVNNANGWKWFTKHDGLPTTGQMGMNVTKPDAKPGGGGAKKSKKKESKKKSPPKPETDDKKTSEPPPPPPSTVPPPPPPAAEEEEDAAGGDDGDSGPSIESPFRYMNLCCNLFPKEQLTFSLPFDDAVVLGETLTMQLRLAWSDLFAPKDDADLIGRLHWGGEDALQFVLDKCSEKTDPLHLGLANFAYTYKVDLGIGSDEHKQCMDNMSSVAKHLSYEGKVGFAAVCGLQCRDFEADQMFKEYASLKDADGSDWLLHRTFGQYLLVVKHKYDEAVTELQAAYKNYSKKDPMTIGWYLAALCKSNKKENKAIIQSIFDDIKLHDTNTDVAVIRHEFMNFCNVKNAADFDGLAKSGETPLLKIRKLICQVKYDRGKIVEQKGMKRCVGPIKAKGDTMYKINLDYFKCEAQWLYDNCLKNCIGNMISAGMACMDWGLGTAMQSYCFAKKDDWDSAQGAIDPFPTKTYHPSMIACAAVCTDSVSEDVDMAKALSPEIFIARINNLRFQKKKTDDALKELTGEFLTQYKQDFGALVALADIWLSRGAVKAAYKVYYTIKSLYPMKYQSNFMLRLKFADCMRLNGFQSESLSEFRTVYASFDFIEKIKKMELEFYSDVLAGFALLLITVGDYVLAEEILTYVNRRHLIKKIANAHLTLLKSSGDNDAVLGVFNDCKESDDNVFLLALGIRAGKMCDGSDTSAMETKLTDLLKKKYSSLTAVVEYCELSAGIKKDASNECLTNNILATLCAKPKGHGTNIYEAMKGVFAKSKTPSFNDTYGVLGSCGVAKVSDQSSVTIIPNASPPSIADITDDYSALSGEAEKEIAAMKSGKVSKAEPSGGSGGGKKKKKGKGGKKKKGDKGGKKSKKSMDAAIDVKAGPKPKVDFKSKPLSERKKWAFKQTEELPQPTSSEVQNWGVNDIGNFIAKIPIFGLNEWYGNKFKESKVTGKMFLNCNEKQLVSWGVDKKCHRARFRAEALSMKRRG